MAAVDPNEVDPTSDDPRAVKFREQLFIHTWLIDGALPIIAGRKSLKQGAVAAAVIDVFRRGTEQGSANDVRGLAAVASWLREQLPRGPGADTRWTDGAALRVAARLYSDSLLAWDTWCNPPRRSVGVGLEARARSENGTRRPDERLWRTPKWMHLPALSAASGLPERTLKQWCQDRRIRAEKRRSFRGPPSWWIEVSDGERSYGHVTDEQALIVDRLRCRRNDEKVSEAISRESQGDEGGTSRTATADCASRGREARTTRGPITRAADGDCWMTLSEASARSGIPESTLRDLCARADLPARRHPDGWRVNLTACANACEDGEAMLAAVEAIAPRPLPKPMTFSLAAASDLIAALVGKASLLPQSQMISAAPSS